MNGYKPKRISRDRYKALTYALEEKAYDLSSNTLSHAIADYFSDSLRPCVFTNSDVEVPEGFNYYYGEDAMDIMHFLNFPCSCEKAAIQDLPLEDQPICLAEVWKDGTVRYYLTVHQIGKCPWKE